MIALSLVSLLVYLFGAYAYGAATVLSLRQAKPVWGANKVHAQGAPQRIEKASLALFALSLAWFVLQTLVEFRTLLGVRQDSWIELATLMVYLFPPVIMHTVFLETQCDGGAPPSALYRRLLAAMYVLSPVVGVYTILAIFRVAPRPGPGGAWIGISIGLLFTLVSAYCTALMLNHPRPTRSTDQRRLRTVMIFLFIAMSGVFVALIFMQEQRLIVAVLDRVTRAAPLYFLIASVYFENRFAFYDLVVKRALLLLLSVVVVGAGLAAVLPWLERLPRGDVRPWLFAVALAPVAMLMPWLHARAERWLDRMWLGREYTPVEAVTHVLAAMQPATDEAALIAAAELRLHEMFGAPIAILVDARSVPAGAVIESEVAMPNPATGAPIRLAVLRAPGMRRILSEDLALLSSLAGVFGFMLENIRLQRRRQEQDLVAQELRLQSSRSELKALRAQINPHFFFNALNAIASLIHSDPARADEAVEQLAEVFRYTLRRSDSEWAPLDQELSFARAYLDVEQARFGQRLTCTIDSDHVPPAPQVPSMLLQTLIENAVKHGVSQTREAGRIEVVARAAGDVLTLEVRNTGPGANDHGRQPREGEGFGLRSIRERLKGHFGDRAALTLSRDEAAGITTARITMPLVKAAAA